tara:strand:+ start:471 stop:971 length:501 start_codon:yes stop_codon:yes gene_type:complete
MIDKDREKTKLKLIKNDDDLTIKQRAFVKEIVRGKLGSQIDCYMHVYDCARTKTGGIPKHAHVDCSKLMANPKIALAVRRGLERKETSSLASGIRTRSYVLEQLMRESKEADSDSTRVRSLELLGKTCGLFSDTIEVKESRPSEDIEEEIEAKILNLLKDADNSDG